MRFYEIAVQQLDLAAELLEEQHPMKSRLALILVDNAVEYALHRYATDRFLDPVPNYLPVLERRAQHRRRAKICGQHIKPKIAFARCTGGITEDQAAFVRNAHEFRNQAYHAGRTHDPIITELAVTYYSVFCEMLPNLAPRMMRFHFDQNLSHRVTRHLERRRTDPMPNADATAESLMRVLPQPLRKLPVACEASLHEKLADIRETIDYLVRNDRTSGDAEALIFSTQFWHEYWNRAPIEGLTVRVNDDGVAEVDPDQRDEWEAALRAMRATWTPAVSASTLDKWEGRIAQLPQESKPGALLQKYCKLQDEMEPFRKMVSERCGRFDRHVDAQIERHLMKD